MGMPTDNAPLEGRSSMGQLIDRINREIDRLQRDVHELSSRVDSMAPGADIHRHHDDHIEIRDRRLERAQLLRTLKAQSIWGVLAFFAMGAAGVIGYALNAWVHGGPK